MARLRTLLRAAREHLDSPFGRFLLLLSCVLVFLFAFHAKTAIYHNAGHIDGSTSSKLWLSGSKLESDFSAPTNLILWIFAFLLLLLVPNRKRRVRDLRHAAIPVPRHQVFLKRFFRPPPTQ